MGIDDEIVMLKNNQPQKPMKRRVAMVDKAIQMSPAKIAIVQDFEQNNMVNSGICHLHLPRNFQSIHIHISSNGTKLTQEDEHIRNTSMNKSNLNTNNGESLGINVTETPIAQMENNDITNIGIHSPDNVLPEPDMSETSFREEDDGVDDASFVYLGRDYRKIRAAQAASNASQTVETAQDNTALKILSVYVKSTNKGPVESCFRDFLFLRTFWNLQNTNSRIIRAQNCKILPLSLTALIQFSLRYFAKPEDPECATTSHIISAVSSLLQLQTSGLISLELNNTDEICNISLTESAIDEFYHSGYCDMLHD